MPNQPAHLLNGTSQIAMDQDAASIEPKAVERFLELWKRPSDPPDCLAFLALIQRRLPKTRRQFCAIDQIHRWQAGLGLPVEDYLERFPDVAAEKPLKVKLIAGEFVCRRSQGLQPNVNDFIGRFPDLCDELRAELVPPAGNSAGESQVLATTVTMPATVVNGDQDGDQEYSKADGPIADEVEGPSTHPAKIGRYRVLRVLGDGGFGRVYLAFDDDLERKVAIKVPHRYRVSQASDVEAYLTEARILARLEHHSIVPVYDCGRTDDGLCFVVSKYIEGGDLATKVKQSPFTFAAAAEVVATIADALHCAHMNGIVHRDIKPANILMDLRDRPYPRRFRHRAQGGGLRKRQNNGRDAPVHEPRAASRGRTPRRRTVGHLQPRRGVV